MESKTSIQSPVMARVAGFGKHPGWSDHIENLGSTSPILSKVEGELYLSAIGSLVTSGDWPASSSGHPLAGLVRRFLWQTGPDFVFGWMWPSSDEVGRDHYPMILCVQVNGCDVPGALPVLDPLLGKAANAIRGTRARQDVVAIVRELQTDLQQALAGVAASGEDAYVRLAGKWAESPVLDGVRWKRLLYFLSTQYEEAGVDDSGTRTFKGRKERSTGFEGMRLPMPAGDPGGGLSGWLAFLRSQIHSDSPILIVHGNEAGWCDVLVGKVTAEALKPILGSDTEVYPVTDVPFDLSEGFQREAVAALAAVGLPWGTSGKGTIFGSAPSRYHPSLPVGGGRIAAEPFGSVSRDDSPTRPAVSPDTPVQRGSGGGTARRIPWIPIGVGIGLVVVVVILMMRGSEPQAPVEVATNGRPRSSAGPGLDPGGVPPVAGGAADGGDPSVVWKQYWSHYTQLRDVAAEVPAQGAWAQWVKDALGDLDPKAWDPWVVGFGGRDRVPGAEVDTISSGKLAGAAGNIRKGAAAAARLMAAATNGYPEQIGSKIVPLAEGPAAGVLPGWRERVAGAGVGSTNPLGMRLRAIWKVETQLDQVIAGVDGWSNGWAQAVALDPTYAALIRAGELARLKQLKSPDELVAALAAGSMAVETARKWGVTALAQADREHLGGKLSALAGELTWTTWSNAVVGARREVQDSEVAALDQRLKGALAGENLRELKVLNPGEGQRFGMELETLTRQFEEIRKTRLVRDHSDAVRSFRSLETNAVGAGRRLEAAWAAVADPGKVVASFLDARFVLPSPVQELWIRYHGQVAERVKSETPADKPAAARRWKAVLDEAWTFCRGVDALPARDGLTQSPWRPRVTDEAWRGDVWTALLAVAVDPATLAVRTEVAPAVEALNRQVEAVGVLVELARGLEGAWDGGRWTNTAVLREGLATRPVPEGFAATLGAFRVTALRELAREVWARPVESLTVPDGATAGLLSAVCERLGGMSDWPKTDAQWQTCCALGGRATAVATWTNRSPQQAWVVQQWKKRMDAGIPVAEIGNVVGPVTAARLEGWLPAGFGTHVRWSRIAAAVQSGRMSDASAEAKTLAAEIGAGRVTELPANRQVLERLVTLKLPDDPFERVDWVTMGQKLGGTFTPDGSRRTAELNLASGVRMAFVLPPDPRLPVLLARTEISAGNLARMLFSKPELARVWSQQKSGSSPALRSFGGNAVSENELSVWNNVGLNTQGARSTLGASLERFPSGSRLRGVAGWEHLSAVGEDLPANCLSANLAQQVAQAIGARLPTPDEWQAVTRELPRRPFGCRPKAVEALIRGFQKARVNADEGAVMVSRIMSCAAAAASVDSGSGPFFQSVEDPGGREANGLQHWCGNVAEYLFDPVSSRFSLAGGSFACSEVNPTEITDPSLPFADAGLRLVVDRVDLNDLAQAKDLLGQVRLGGE